MIYEHSPHDHYQHRIQLRMRPSELRQSKQDLYRDLRAFYAARGVYEVTHSVTDHDALMDCVVRHYGDWLENNVGPQRKAWLPVVMNHRTRDLTLHFMRKDHAMMFKLTHSG